MLFLCHRLLAAFTVKPWHLGKPTPFDEGELPAAIINSKKARKVNGLTFIGPGT
jgi:hypothetical protein